MVLLNEFLVFVLEYEKSLRDSVVVTVHLLVCLLSLTPRALISLLIRSTTTTTRFVSNPFIGLLDSRLHALNLDDGHRDDR